MINGLDIVGKQSDIVMAIKGPSHRTLLIPEAQSLSVSCATIKKFMKAESEYVSLTNGVLTHSQEEKK